MSIKVASRNIFKFGVRLNYILSGKKYCTGTLSAIEHMHGDK